MAEAIAISLSAKLALALSCSAAASLSPLLSIRSELTATIQDLHLLRAFLRLADSRQGTDGLAAEWVKQIRDAVFELEDVADECCYLSSSNRGLVDVVAWLALSRNLRKARERLHRLSAAKEAYGIRLPDGPALPVAITQLATSSSGIVADNAHFLEKEETFGCAEYKKQLLEWVVGDAEPRRKLVAVWGMGGVGKTTLVTHVYKKLMTTHFECAAWVAVSQGFTMDDLLVKILKELHRDARARGIHGRSETNDTGYRFLVEAVRSHLVGRSYLVVLDDIWDAQLWDKLRHAFPDDNTGSRVVITTRSRDVAHAAAPGKLFCSAAFREVPGQSCPSHLRNLAENMLEQCHGLPLAIVSIGKLLVGKGQSEYAWSNVQASLVWDKSSRYLGIGEAASILNLSIDDLPHHLKKCFLSCSIYGEDFLIKRKILIRNWIAQGFVDDEMDPRIAEDVADDYLDQLVQRSLMQVVERNEFGRPKRFLIHDLIRELITHRSREEGFLQLTKCKVRIDCDLRIRHLAVDRCEIDSQSIPNQSSLRSFYAFGSEMDALFLCRFRLLTVLNLWFIATNKLPDSVTRLYNLRYLGIRSTLIEELPEDIGRLQRLQTLDTKFSMVKRLPRSIAKLKSLRHIILFRREAPDFGVAFPGMAVEISVGLEKLTCLQTLKYVQANKKMVRSLASLDLMRSLDVSGLDAGLVSHVSLSISRMSCLRRLALEMEPGEEGMLDLDPAPVKLQKLTLTGSFARGKLPAWIYSLTNLVWLQLCDCNIAQDSLVHLGKLPRLVNLSLTAAYNDRFMTFSRGSFPSLQKMTLKDLPNLCHIEFQQGCLVNLQDIVLGHCKMLIEAPKGLENFVDLPNVELYGMSDEFVNNLKQQKGYATFDKPTNFQFSGAHRPLRYWRWIHRNKS
ncbi:hypothetical protein PR202_ga25392 [Eleusine coracana subsp. coracana]|uniref:Disease resistance protein RPM1 n=1 Tax=Eleusine coracana subsp. coracana TaxID=191504 RepID=A0AAV5DB83_ELECO|nr:hypothetical protein PR202_ga25392 [Eleusine coracana subsp. coracana]